MIDYNVEFFYCVGYVFCRQYLQVGVNIVYCLNHDPRPVNGVDGGQVMTFGEGVVPEA